MSPETGAVQETLTVVGSDPCTAVRLVGGAAAKIKIYLRMLFVSSLYTKKTVFVNKNVHVCHGGL